MNRILVFIFLIGSSLATTAQKVDWKKIEAADPDRILLDGRKKPTEVLLLGTFHFDYPNLDAHKTDSSKHIDVLSTDRQKEIEELANVIKRFKPTRIYIESFKQKMHDSLYNEYRNGRYKLGRNEIYQLGYRIAKEMKLSKLYAVDAGNFASDNYKKYQWIDSMWNTKAVTDSLRDQYWQRLYTRVYDAGDSMDTKLTMLESFLMMAQPSVLNRMHGAYLTGGFNTTNNDGPDMLSIWWFNRNLRILNNILNTKPGPDDRILVIFGNGHASILKDCFASSPEFKLVELKSLLK